MKMQITFKDWVKSGSPFIWLNAGAVAISIIMVLGLVGFIASKGLVHFWPAAIVQASYTLPGNASVKIVGQVTDSEMVKAEQLEAIGLKTPNGAPEAQRLLLKVGNRDVYGGDFRWVLDHHLTEKSYPQKAVVIERREWGNFYGYLNEVFEGSTLVADANLDDSQSWQEFQSRIERALTIHDNIMDIQKGEIGSINYKIERLRLEERRLELNDELSEMEVARLQFERDELNAEYKSHQKKLSVLY
ncbi:phosphate ABC transporter, permease protein PstA, partial [Bermanella sp. 47_1433_sub80_T6]